MDINIKGYEFIFIMIHNITFSIPESKITKSVPKKTKMLATVIPKLVHTYIFDKEEDYYEDYRKSMFGITMCKSGWDCMRHYEIIACGCIPYFVDIEKCPRNTMTLLPKDLFLKCNDLYMKYKNYSIGDFSEEEMKECNEMIALLLDYTRKNLTTVKLAKYVLKKSGQYSVSSILYLSGDTSPDYMRCLTLHGLKEIFGKKCHDYPIIPHIYKSDTIDFKKLYGKGMTYSNILDRSLHDDACDENIEKDIKNKKYDIVIYGSFHRGMPFYELVNSVYLPNEILLICGEDLHPCNYYQFTNKGHCLFVREL